jgi:1-deoxy-D-xylulose-5-phosphate reductoisomerase
MIKIALFGSTGSIGQNTLQVVRDHPDHFRIVCLTAYQNTELLIQQALEFKPEFVGIFNSAKLPLLQSALSGNNMRIVAGIDNMTRLAGEIEADMMVNSIVGSAGLLPTISAIRSGKNIGLANKETLVAAGEIVTRLAKENQVQLVPIDSEHSAIFQCLQGEDYANIRKIILTASGGPFRNFSKQQLESVSVEQALKHPNWNMGSKITIDSATLMNKGLEVIEARWLFGVPADRIDVVVHPQSMIHSMVEMIDGSVKAQLGLPDMKLPIQYALSYPGRLPGAFPTISWNQIQLDFSQPDRKSFRCLDLAYEALRTGGSLPAAMNAANESAVHLFLNKKISFLQISELIEKTMLSHTVIPQPSIDDILQVDLWARDYAQKNI